MIVEVLPVGPLQANAYLLRDAGHAVLVDPGGEPQRLLAALERTGAVLDAVWLTHGDFDHVGGLAGVLSARPVPVWLHPLDRPLMAAAGRVAAAFGVDFEDPPNATRDLDDGHTLTVGTVTATCLHTPGHTPGHVAFHLPSEELVLSGDALFRGSIGRTDRPQGDTATLLRSIHQRLLTLPPDTRVLPGHGPETRIDLEVAGNPFLQSM